MKSELKQQPENRKETGKKKLPVAAEPFKFKPGQSGNPGGRPKGTLKDYVRRKFMEMSDKEKEKWLKEHRVQGDIQWRMAEGNPANETDITTKGEKINAISAEDIALAKKLNDESNTGTDQSSEGSVAESVDSEVSDQK